jgi:tubulin alpha
VNILLHSRRETDRRYIGNGATEPYNAVLSTHGLVENTDLSFCVDNESLYRLCLRNLKVESPTYTNINRLIAQVASGVTASMRFGGALNADMGEILTNLVPYPRLHFVAPAFAPAVPADRAFHEQQSVAGITNEVFEPGSLFLKCDPQHGKYMACCLMYRGDVTPKDVAVAVGLLRDTPRRRAVTFVDWSPTGVIRLSFHKTDGIECGNGWGGGHKGDNAHACWFPPFSFF